MKRAIALAVLNIVAVGELFAATPHYFATTAAGFIPPVANPIARKQFLPQIAAMTYDAHGVLYYASFNQIWRLNADGTDTLVAGKAVPGVPGDGGPPALASFYSIFGLAFDPQQNLYIADQGAITGSANTGTIRKLTPDGKISTLVSGIEAYELASDNAGNLWVTTFGTVDASPVLEITPDGKVSTKYTGVGGGTLRDIAVVGSKVYFIEFGKGLRVLDTQTGAVTTLVPNVGAHLAAGPDGALYLQLSQNVVSRFVPGVASPQPFAGSGAPGSFGDGGPATQAGIICDAMAVNPANGDLAIADTISVTVRVVSGNKIQTVVGAPRSGGDGGPAVLAQFATGGEAMDGAGNIYILDAAGARVRKISPAGLITTIAGNGVAGNSGDGGKATMAAIVPGTSIAADRQGNVYFVNGTPLTVRKVDTNGVITTVAGGGTGPLTNGALATDAALTSPDNQFFRTNIGVDGMGNLYIGLGTQILRVDSSGKLFNVAGTGQGGNSSDGMSAQSPIGIVSSIAVDAAGNVYFGDQTNEQLRMVDQRGLLQTIAGNGSNVIDGKLLPSGPARSINIGIPQFLAIDAAGNIFFHAEVFNSRPQVVMVDPAGNLTPVAGGAPRANGSSGDGGDASLAGFVSLTGLVLDGSGNIFLSDGDYVRRLALFDPLSPPPFLATGGVVGAGGSFPAIAAVAPDGHASLYGANFIAAGTHHDLSPSDLVNGKVPTNMVGVCVNFGGASAAMLNVYPGQINVQVPPLPPGPVTVQVTTNCGKSSAVTSNFAGVVTQTASPEFFSFLPDPMAGKNPIAAINALTFVRVGVPGLLPGVTFATVQPGDIVEAYGTGWGLTIPAIGVGGIPGAAAPLASPFTLTFAGSVVAPANIFYAGAAPCCAGLYQVDFTVPAGTPSGNQSLILTVAGTSSPAGAYITVQQ